MPATLLTLPFELRDEICTYVALSSDFSFLLACRQLNEEFTPLIYKYGTYRVRALSLRSERLPPFPKPPQASLVQSLYISMPPEQCLTIRSKNYEISRRTASKLEQFGGTGIRRQLCHFNLQGWTLSPEMSRVLCGYVGFDVVRVEVRLKPYEEGYDGRPRTFSIELEDEYKASYVRSIEDTLGPALGKATWERKESGTCFEEVRVAEFLPRQSKQ